jgi:hypothetical protein
VALGVTQLIYPIGYELVSDATLPGLLLVHTRNLLLAATAVLAFRAALDRS